MLILLITLLTIVSVILTITNIILFTFVLDLVQIRQQIINLQGKFHRLIGHRLIKEDFHDTD